jgi:phosphate transport system permease protein
MFKATPLNTRNKRIELGMQSLFLAMTILLATPVLIILTVLVYNGAPIISWEFLFEEPTNGMTAGGIFPALVGTIS